MAAGPELNAFSTRTSQTLNNVRRTEALLEDAAAGVAKVKQVIDTLQRTQQFVETANESIDTQLPALMVAEQNPAIRPFATAYKNALEFIEPRLERVQEIIESINFEVSRDPDTGQERRLLDVLDDAADRAETAIANTLDAVRDGEATVGELDGAVSGYRAAFNRLDVIGTVDGVAVAAQYTGLIAAVEAQMATRNAVTGDLVDGFNAAVGRVLTLVESISDARIEELFAVNADFGVVEDLFNVVQGPLNAATALLRPLQPLLDAIGFIQRIFVDPIVNFVLETLQLDDLLESVAAQLTSQVPGAEFFQDFLDQGQQLVDELQSLVDTNFGVSDALARIETDLLGGVVGNPLAGPTTYGSTDLDLIVGSTSHDIIDGRAGDDRITAGNGNDIIVASEGDDVVFGGAGTDMIFLSGLFDEYEFAVDENTNAIVVTHLLPGRGINEGVETLHDVEFISFANIAFSSNQIENAIIGASVLNGDPVADDLIFLNSRADTDNDPRTNTNADSQHVANGLGGDDTIFGSTSTDELNGGAGDDVLIPGQGVDEVNGGADTDTFQELAGRNTNTRLDLNAGTAFAFGGQNTLISIENALVQGDGDHVLQGDNAANVLTSAGGSDLLTGRGGNDSISAGDEADLLFGGAGADSLFGGKENDILISDSAARSGVRDFYDGGEGADTVSYSTNYDFYRQHAQNENIAQSTVLAAFTPGAASGPVRIFGETGRIERLDAAGRLVTIDTAANIETFIGSDADDVIHGKIGEFRAATEINGADGDDMIFADGANTVGGGEGDDILIATPAARPVQIPGGLSFDGGGGRDRLDLGPVGDARWYLQDRSGGNTAVQAFDPGVTGNLNQLGGQNFFFATVDGIEEYAFGDFDDLVDFQPGGTFSVEFRLGGGNDRMTVADIDATIFGGAGDDVITQGTNGRFFGEAGNDSITWNDGDPTSVSDMGAGADLVVLRRFEGEALGRDGFDTIAFNLTNARIDVDLAAGSAVSTRTSGNLGQLVDARISGFESAVGTVGNDVIRGAGQDETLIGRNGADMLDGRDGDDKLYGGESGDALLGGNGDDLLHGGAGTDRIDGQAGNDTVSYAFAVPNGLDGGIEAGNFGGVTVDLAGGRASGAQGADTLLNIENAIGSGGGDRLTGTAANNFLSGLEGDDILSAGAGADVISTGAGADAVDGGAGSDTIFAGVGAKSIDGGAGVDTVSFAGLSGTATLFFDDPNRTEAGARYDGQFEISTAVWADTGTTEARNFRNVNLTPQDVREADPLNANSPDDLTRVLPTDNDPASVRFAIREVMTLADASGVVDGVERFFSGAPGATTAANGVDFVLRPSAGVDFYDGTGSRNDILDLTDETTPVMFNLATGQMSAALLRNDTFIDIEGVRGGSGNNSLIGSAGNDPLAGGAGDDVLVGRGGNDVLEGGDGFDRLNGGAGADRMLGGRGSDIYTVDDRGDRVIEAANGGAQDRVNVFVDFVNPNYIEFVVGLFSSQGLALTGSQGRESIVGANRVRSPDTIEGRGGNDRLVGLTGDDVIDGGAGNDRIFGNSGMDTITGGAGDDRVTGQFGADRFIHRPGDDFDRITDFRSGEDMIDLTAHTVSSFAQVLARASTTMGGTLIDLANGDAVFLEGVARGSLSQADFLLGS